jgi:hypothetical protein
MGVTMASRLAKDGIRASTTFLTKDRSGTDTRAGQDTLRITDMADSDSPAGRKRPLLDTGLSALGQALFIGIVFALSFWLLGPQSPFATGSLIVPFLVACGLAVATIAYVAVRRDD